MGNGQRCRKIKEVVQRLWVRRRGNYARSHLGYSLLLQRRPYTYTSPCSTRPFRSTLLNSTLYLRDQGGIVLIRYNSNLLALGFMPGYPHRLLVIIRVAGESGAVMSFFGTQRRRKHWLPQVLFTLFTQSSRHTTIQLPYPSFITECLISPH